MSEQKRTVTFDVPPICSRCGEVLERLNGKWYCPECATFRKPQGKSR